HDLLQRIYGYAAWSSRQPGKAVWNAVCVTFYEHLFDRHQSEEWIEAVAGWIPADVARRGWPLWEAGPHPMSPVDRERLRKAPDARGGANLEPSFVYAPQRERNRGRRRP